MTDLVLMWVPKNNPLIVDGHESLRDEDGYYVNDDLFPEEYRMGNKTTVKKVRRIELMTCFLMKLTMLVTTEVPTLKSERMTHVYEIN